MSKRVVLWAIATFVIGCGSVGVGPVGPEQGRAGKASPEEIAERLQRAREKAPPPPRCKDEAPPAAEGSQPTMVLQDGHTQMIMGVVLSRDGRLMASAGMDGIARIWDTRSGLLLRRVRTASNTFALALSADGKTLATYAPRGKGRSTKLTVEVHDLDSGKAPVVVELANYLFALTPDGSQLAVATAGVDLYDAKSGKRLGRAPFGTTQALTMDADGGRLAAAATDQLVVVAVPSMKITHRFKNVAYRSIQDVVGDIALAGDALWIRSTIGEVHRVDLASKKVAATLPGKHLHMALGQGVLWTLEMGSGKVLAWDAATGKPRGTRGQAVANARKIAASGDGSTVAIATSHPTEGFDLLVRDAESGTALQTLRGENSALATLAISPDGQRVASGSQIGVITRWNAKSGKLEGVAGRTRTTGTCLSYDASGKTLAVASGGAMARTMEAATGRVTRQWPAHQGATTVARFLPGTSKLVTAGWDGAARIWDLGGAPPKPLARAPFPHLAVAAPAQPQEVASVPLAIVRGALSKSGRLLAVLGTAGSKPAGMKHYLLSQKLELALIDLESGRVRWRKPLKDTLRPHGFVAVSADDASVLVSIDEKKGQLDFHARLKIFDAKTGALRETRPLEYNAPLAFLGDTLAIGGREPSLESWPGPSKRRPLRLPDVDITTIAVDEPRQRFVFGGNSGATSITDQQGKLVAVMINTSNGEFVTTTPDGAFVASLDGRRNVGWTFLEPLEGFSFAQFSDRYNRADVVAARLAGKAGAELAGLTRPPRIRLAKTAERAKAKVSLTAEVSSQRRVERVRAYVNARPVVDQLVCAPAKTVPIEVPLEPGRNRITLISYDADGHSSKPASIDVASDIDAPPPDLWAVTVGVSRYPKLAPSQQLEFADDDARAIVSALEPLAGGHFGKLHATTLVDDQVTPSSVAEALEPLAGMKAHDLAVVFLAGHGVRLKDGNMVLLTPKADLTPHGAAAGGIGWDRIEAILRAARGRVVLLLDACHSGHVSTELIAPNEDLATRLAQDNRAGVLIFAASRGSQYSYEVGPPGSQAASRGLELAWEGRPPQVAQIPATGHGLFTSAVLEALTGKAVDRDGSGGIELGEFTNYVTERVSEASNGMQTPWVVRQELFGDFLVVPAP